MGKLLARDTVAPKRVYSLVELGTAPPVRMYSVPTEQERGPYQLPNLHPRRRWLQEIADAVLAVTFSACGVDGVWIGLSDCFQRVLQQVGDSIDAHAQQRGLNVDHVMYARAWHAVLDPVSVALKKLAYGPGAGAPTQDILLGVLKAVLQATKTPLDEFVSLPVAPRDHVYTVGAALELLMSCAYFVPAFAGLANKDVSLMRTLWALKDFPAEDDRLAMDVVELLATIDRHVVAVKTSRGSARSAAV